MKYDILISAEQYTTKDDAIFCSNSFKKAIIDKRAIFKSYSFPYFKKALTSRIVNFGTISHPRLFGIDIDNENKNGIFDYKEICALLLTYRIAPIVVLETLSFSENHPRYRFIFCLNEDTKDIAEYKTVVSKVIDLINGFFGSRVADPSCNKATTIFYPGARILLSEPENIVSKSVVLSYRRTNSIPLYFSKFAYNLHRRMNLISDHKFRSRTERQNFSRYLCVPFSNYLRCHIVLPSTINMISDTNQMIAKKTIECIVNIGAARATLPEFSGTHLRKPAVEAPKRVYGSLKEQIESTPISFLLNQKENVFFEDVFGDKNSEGKPLYGMCYRSSVTGKSYYAVYDYGDKTEKYRYDIFSFIGRIFNTNGFKENMDFIAHECGITINPIPPKKMVKNIDDCLENLDAKLNKYPNLASVLNDNHKVKPLFIEILNRARKAYQNLAANADTDGDQILMSSSLFKETRRGTVNLAFRLLNRLGLLHELKPNEFNFWTKARIKAYTSNKANAVKTYRFITFPKFTDDLFRIADELAKNAKDAGINIYLAQKYDSTEDKEKIKKVLSRYSEYWKEKRCDFMPIEEAEKILGDDFERMHFAMLEQCHFEEFILDLRFVKRYGLEEIMKNENWKKKTHLLRCKYMI